MENNLSFWSFWFRAIKTTFRTVLGIISTVMLALAIIFAIISAYHPVWEDWLNTFAWAFPLALFLVLFVPIVMVQSHFMYKKKAEKVDEYETQAIKFIVEDTDQFIKPRLTGAIVCRVGIKAISKKTICDVSAFITHINGEKNSNSSSPLYPAECRLEDPPSFNINPSEEPKFVEVVSWDPQKKDILGIHYYTNYQEIIRTRQQPHVQLTDHNLIRNEIDIKEKKSVRFTLCVTGQNIQPIKEDVIVQVNDDNSLSWYIAN